MSLNREQKESRVLLGYCALAALAVGFARLYRSLGTGEALLLVALLALVAWTLVRRPSRVDGA